MRNALSWGLPYSETFRCILLLGSQAWRVTAPDPALQVRRAANSIERGRRCPEVDLARANVHH